MKKRAKYEAATRKLMMKGTALMKVAWEREPRPSGTDLTPQMVASFIKQLKDRAVSRSG